MKEFCGVAWWLEERSRVIPRRYDKVRCKSHTPGTGWPLTPFAGPIPPRRGLLGKFKFNCSSAPSMPCQKSQLTTQRSVSSSQRRRSEELADLSKFETDDCDFCRGAVGAHKLLHMKQRIGYLTIYEIACAALKPLRTLQIFMTICM